MTEQPMCLLGALMQIARENYKLEPEQVEDFETTPLAELRKQIRNTLAANIEDWGGEAAEADAMLDAYDRRMAEETLDAESETSFRERLDRKEEERQREVRKAMKSASDAIFNRHDKA